MREKKSQANLVESSRYSLSRESQAERTSSYSNDKRTPSKDFGAEIFKTLEASSMNRKVMKLFNALKNHCGRHHPIEYRPQFAFSEYWEDKKNKFQESNTLQYFQFPNQYYFVFTIFILVSKLALVWTISVHRLYQMDAQDQLGIMLWGLLTLASDVFMKYELFTHYDYFKQKSILKYLKSFWKDVVLSIYFISFPLHFQEYSKALLILDILMIYLLSNRCKELMICLRLQITATSYKNVYDLVQLFTMLLPIAHIFALMLYSVAMCRTQKNWLVVNDLHELPPLEKYIYSLYFTLTTMLTVGYGDISPVIIPEIIVVMLIQIIGIVTYGYIINSIGNIINCMRMEDQVLSRDISTITRMAKYYDIDKCLVQKAKNFLVFQKKQRGTLTPEEEESTLRKLHDDLRQEISQENSLRVVKSSLFYVCNWTKRLQVEIAKKLHKKIFTPNEEILQTPGKQRVYVFKKGKVEIYANRTSGYKRHFKKILRTIEPNETMEVSDNIYGYSFLMSNTPIKLTAINKEFVVAYFVEKKDFLETVLDSQLDSEHYFEMKTRIDSMTYPESWEAPLIINTKEHYFPNIQYLIIQNKKLDQRQRNSRSSDVDMRRFRNKSKRVFYRNFEQMQGQYYPNMTDLISECLHSEKESKSQKQINIVTFTSKTQDNVFHSSTSQISNPITPASVGFKKQNINHLLEQGKEYYNYFKRYNRSQVLLKMENSNFMMNAKDEKKIEHVKIKNMMRAQKRTLRKTNLLK